MDTQKHTPGPWVYIDLGEVVAADNFEVTIARLDVGRVNAENDGALLAAAPEMHVALREVAKEMGSSGLSLRVQWLIVDAISSAEGLTVSNVDAGRAIASSSESAP